MNFRYTIRVDMLLSADTMRLLLGLCLIGMALVAVFYLRRRQLTFWQYLAWGLLIIFLPLLGPFITILMAPGKPEKIMTKNWHNRRKNRRQGGRWTAELLKFTKRLQLL